MSCPEGDGRAECVCVCVCVCVWVGVCGRLGRWVVKGGLNLWLTSTKIPWHPCSANAVCFIRTIEGSWRYSHVHTSTHTQTHTHTHNWTLTVWIYTSCLFLKCTYAPAYTVWAQLCALSIRDRDTQSNFSTHTHTTSHLLSRTLCRQSHLRGKGAGASAEPRRGGGKLVQSWKSRVVDGRRGRDWGRRERRAGGGHHREKEKCEVLR